MLDLRFLCSSLREDYSQSFKELLQTRLSFFMNNFDVECSLYFASDLCAGFDSATKENLLYAVNEILSNAVHHAKAQKVTVRVIDSAKEFVLRIADDGTNFTGIQEKDGHFGIKNIKSRIQKCGGTVEWIKTTGGGCEVVVRI